jgi:hypothetical protein
VLCVSLACGQGRQLPVILFSDIVSGPGSGGKDNKGAFVTIVGKNFGNNPGTSYVSIGGGRVDNYPVWSDTKITFQVGNAAVSGPIIVVTPEGASNGLPFTVRPGNIYFVNPAVLVDGSGSFADPWRSGVSYFGAMRPGDLCYFRTGVYSDKMGSSSGRGNITISGPAPDGLANNEIAWLAYPGEVARLEAGQGDIRSNLEISKNYYVIAGFQMYTQGTCIEFGGDNNRVVNNTCEGLKKMSYGNIHTNGGMGGKIYGNELFGARSGNKLDHAIYVAWGPKNMEIGWNYIHDNDIAVGPVISVNTDGALGNGIVFQNIRIHDNIIDCRRSSSALRAIGIVETGRGSSVYIYNNIVIDPGSDTSYYNGIYQYSGSAYIYNNTFFNCKGPAAFLAKRSNSYMPETVDVRNNIFYTQTGCKYIEIPDAASMGKVIVSNNCYHGNGDGPGTDPHPVNADPLFVDPWKGDDFHLLGNSPCIDAGDNRVSWVVGTDKDGRVRQQSGTSGTYDIGAYEAPAGKAHAGLSGTRTGSSGRLKSEKRGARSKDFAPAFSSATASVPVERVRIDDHPAGREAFDPDQKSVRVYFTGEEKGKFECRIFTLNGDLVWSDSKQDVSEGIFEWNARDAAGGIYIINVTGPGVKSSKKITVLR